MQTRFKVSRQGHDLGSFPKEEIVLRLKAEDFSSADSVFLPENNEWMPVPDFVRSYLPSRTAQAAELTSVELTSVAVTPPADSAVGVDHGATITNFTSLTSIGKPAKPPPKAPPVKAPPMAPPPALKTKGVADATRGKVTLNGGVGTIELTHFTAGKLKVSVAEANAGLAAEAVREVVVKGAQAAKLIAIVPPEVVAGQKTNVIVEARDQWGNRDTTYKGAVTLQLASGMELGTVKLAEGRGTAVFSVKKADTYVIKLVDSEQRGLDVSTACEFKCIAGPAAKLLISTPAETTAGEPVKVQVKAVDRYGNLATACNDDVEVEVAAAPIETPVSDSARKAG